MQSRTVLPYLFRRLVLGVLPVVTAVAVALLLTLGALLVLGRDEVRALPLPALALAMLAEVAPVALLLGVPLGVAVTLDRLREDGDLRAARLLPLRPATVAFGLAAAVLPFLLLQHLLVHRATPAAHRAARTALVMPASLDALPRAGVLGDAVFTRSERGSACQLFAWRSANQYLALDAAAADATRRPGADYTLTLTGGRVHTGDAARAVPQSELAFARAALRLPAPRERVDLAGVTTGALTEHRSRLARVAARGGHRIDERIERELRDRATGVWALLVASLLAVLLGARTALTRGERALAFTAPPLLAGLAEPVSRLLSGWPLHLTATAVCAALVAALWSRRT